MRKRKGKPLARANDGPRFFTYEFTGPKGKIRVVATNPDQAEKVARVLLGVTAPDQGPLTLTGRESLRRSSRK